MKILVVSNRQVVAENITNEGLFGEQLNVNGSAEIRLAWAERVKKEWQLKLIKEPAELTVDTLPSRNAYREFKEALIEANQDGLFYVHGFNSTFVSTLQQAHDLQKRYGVGVVLFSWPSNPGGFIVDEYAAAQAIAKLSNVALDRVFEKIGLYLSETVPADCGVSFNLLLHSMGNFLFKNYVEEPIFTGETRFFDNIVLHQADTDNRGHADWVNKLHHAKRVYVTINERDALLAASDAINLDRLGNTVRKLNAKTARYINFTGAQSVKFDHAIFGETADQNENIKGFFERAFAGKKAEKGPGLKLNDKTNAYEVA